MARRREYVSSKQMQILQQLPNEVRFNASIAVDVSELIEHLDGDQLRAFFGGIAQVLAVTQPPEAPR